MAIEFCADVIALYKGKLVLVNRQKFPKGLALPGGRLEVNESLELCAIREFKEETGLDFHMKHQLGTYSEPHRDPRGQKISTAFVGEAFGKIKNEKQKTKVVLLNPKDIEKNKNKFVFDHYKILMDCLNSKYSIILQNSIVSSNIAKEMITGMDNFSEKIEIQKKIYLRILELANKDKSKKNIVKITEPKLFLEIIAHFGAFLDSKRAKYNLMSIYDISFHKETGALIINNKGANLFSLSPKTSTPHILRHLGFCIYLPGVGIEFINVGLVGNIYSGHVVFRSESACTPSFLFGSQRCNCNHQWENIRELAANFNKVNVPKFSNGEDFENWVQRQVTYKENKFIFKSKGDIGFILLHIDTQNGMGSGYSENIFSFDLFSRASLRHRGEYTSEQVHNTTMYGGFEAIGITPDPRKLDNCVGYKIAYIILEYLNASKNIVFLTNNPLKLHHFKNNGYKIKRLKTIGAVNLAGAKEAEERGTEFNHIDINCNCVTFEEDYNRLKLEIGKIINRRNK